MDKAKKEQRLQELLEYCKRIHNNKYDYSLITVDSYVNSLTKVKIICPIHGIFEQPLSRHKQGKGCRRCGLKKTADSVRQRCLSSIDNNMDTFVQKSRAIHNNKYDYSLVEKDDYLNKRVKILCSEHGVFVQNPALHAFGQGCPKCGSIKSQSLFQKCSFDHISRQHISNTVLRKLNDKQWLANELQDQAAWKVAKKLGVHTNTIHYQCAKHGISLKRFPKSQDERDIVNFIREITDVEVITGDRSVISPLELDIYLPECSLAIEYNGLYWHSEINGKKSNYHLNKTQLCEQKGIRLIHIFEDEWRDQQQKCKETLIHLLGKSPKGTYARDSYIKEISWNQARDFLARYHLLDAGSSGNYRIGAFDKHTDELIGVMVFGRSTSEGSNEIELKRFVTNKKNNPGLGSKMFKYAVNQRGYQEVIAFVDRRWFTGLVKDYIGFKKIGETNPAIWWTDGINRFHRRFTTKKKLIQQFNFPSNTSKRDMLRELGFYRIWDCGKLKLQWIKLG